MCCAEADFHFTEIFLPILTCGQEIWVGTERTRLQIQAAEMGFLPRVAGLSLRDGVRSSAIPSRATAPAHRKEPDEVVWASG